MKRDDLIFDIIEKEHQRQLKGIELIASENFVSDQVMQAMGSCLTNKYAEGYPGKRYYGGCEVVDQSEQIAIDRLKQIFGAEWANVQPHSGAQANAAVFLAVLNPGDKFMGLNLAHGGHLSHGSAVNTSGIIYTPCEYNLNKETGRVDYDQMEEIALRERPKMIIGGGSAYSREWDYKRMREIADKAGAIFMVDMAHPAGLIAAGLLDNPVKYAHIVTSTTHKTLRGPRGGVIMMGKDFPNPWGKKTPKGEIKTMPAQCTALDFAFQIHTFLGSHCIGAKVNHKLVPLSHKLQSGDQVEILSSKSQHVQASWINFVFTAKAKQKIMAILRRDNRELQKRGEQILDDWLRKNELEMTTQVLNKLCELHEAKKHEDLFLMLGKRSVLLGDKDLDELRERKAEQGGWRKFVPFLKKDNSKDDKKSNLFIVGEGFNKKKPVIINEENISQYIFPTCCHAIPGDDIMGYIDNKNRIEIHRRNCDVASRLKASFGNRILDAKWDMHKVMFFDATIELRGIDRKGMLHDISEVISDKLDVNMHRITISSEEGIFDGTIEIRVHDRSEVSVIMDELKKIEDLKEVLQIL